MVSKSFRWGAHGPARLRKATVLAIATLAFGLAGCSLVKPSDLGVGGGGKTAAAPGADKVNVSLAVRSGDATARLALSAEEGPFLSLAPSEGFTFDVKGCASGFLANGLTSNATSEPVALYAHDRNCFFDLREFGFEGDIFQPSGGATSFFNGGIFDASRTVYFERTTPPNDKVRVRIQTTLSSPLQDGEEFVYVFMEIKKGADFAVQDYSYTETMEVGAIEAPNLTIDDMDLTAIDGATGKATFTTTLKCAQSVTTVATKKVCPSPTGENQALENFSTILISEPADPSMFDYVAARALFDDAANSGIIHALTNAVTVTADAFDVSNQQKSGPLSQHKAMYLVVQFTDPNDAENRSYRYFKVTIGDPQL